MELFRPRADIPFMRYAPIFNAISLFLFLVAFLAILLRGLALSIEFTGGTIAEVRAETPIDLSQLRHHLQQNGFPEAQAQHFGTTREAIIRLATVGKTPETIADRLRALIAAELPALHIARIEYVGPQVGRELAENGAIALALVVVGIMLYLAARFEWRFSLAAILANLHDVVIILGFFALFQWEFSLTVLAAVLAVLGYSVNETVVIFDRVRETMRKSRGPLSTAFLLDHAITATLSRTVITHGSTLAMVLSILLFGGETLYYFALALTIGILFGIYSSIFVSAALLMWLGVRREHLIKPERKKEEAVV
ncbi:MAG: protein translocase subunit SecF [Hydrogenophilus sp.]|nr:protein translocase subunit SecF [Hydrogenophilus sp.]